MIRTKLAKKVLTKKEQDHLTDCGINSMKSFLQTREEQIKMKKQYEKDGLHSPEPCWDCRMIAGKLGVN